MDDYSVSIKQLGSNLAYIVKKYKIQSHAQKGLIKYELLIVDYLFL